MYEGTLGMDGSMETMEDVLMSQAGAGAATGGQQNGSAPQGALVNPIDKLYSMQTSYFSAAD